MIKAFSPKGNLFFLENLTVISPTPHHYHNYYEFYFLTDGTCHYLINNDTYNLIAGDIVIIPKGVIHKTFYDDTPSKRYLICCSSHYIPSSVIENLPQMPYVYRNRNTIDSIHAYLKQIENEYNSQLSFRDEVLLNLFQLLLLTLVRGHSKSTPVPNANAQISEILSYLRDNFKGNCSLEQVASTFSISSEHLSRIFKKETGVHFSEYRTMLRLREAETLFINNPDLTIIEAAHASGFNDSNYFSQKFKEFHGVSPSKFRNMQK